MSKIKYKGIIYSNTKCKQCGHLLDMFEYLTSKEYPICNKCVKKNHNKIINK
jgi:predicted nucleic acid-binding Zn ribbon protein